MAPISSTADPRYVKAMSNPVRARIVAMLSERQASPRELATWLGTSLGATAYHVRTLYKNDLIELSDEQRVRGAVEHFYRARPLPQPTPDADVVSHQVRAAAALEMIETRLRPAADAGGFDGPHAVLDRTELDLDEQGLAALANECQRLLERAAKIAEQSARRLTKTGAPGQHAELAVFALQVPPLAEQIPTRTRRSRPPPLPSRRRNADTPTVVLATLQREPSTISELAVTLDRSTGSVRNAIGVLVAQGHAQALQQRRRMPDQRGPGAIVYAYSQ